MHYPSNDTVHAEVHTYSPAYIRVLYNTYKDRGGSCPIYFTTVALVVVVVVVVVVVEAHASRRGCVMISVAEALVAVVGFAGQSGDSLSAGARHRRSQLLPSVSADDRGFSSIGSSTGSSSSSSSSSRRSMSRSSRSSRSNLLLHAT